MKTTARAISALTGAAALAALLSLTAGAARTSFVATAGFEEFASGEGDGIAVTADGSVELGPSLSKLAVGAAGYVWDATRAPDGRIYAVTGTPGALVRIDGDEHTVLLSEETADLAALARAPDGRVFVGSAPGGVVTVVAPDGGGGNVLIETGQGYIWCMEYSPAHGLLVGTGDAARVYAVRATGRAETIFESDEASVTALAAVGDRVLAGTAGEGLLVDVTPGQRPRVLFDSPYEEITGIASDASGAVYFAASTIAFEEMLDEPNGDGGSYGDGSLYRMEGDAVVELWEAIGVPLTCVGPAADGALVGTAANGRIHALDRDGRRSVVAELDTGEILAIESHDGRLLVATGRPGGVFEEGRGGAARGSLVSRALDAGSGARWGRLLVRAETPRGTGVRAETRSGNTELPGEGWSEWAPLDDGGAGSVGSPAARFLQWRLTLESDRGGATPTVREVELSFRNENRPPRVRAVVVHDPADAGAVTGPGLGQGMVSQRLPSGLEVTYSPGGPGEGGDLASLIRGHRTAEWQADDPDGDRLRFDLDVRPETGEVWTSLATDVESAAYTWDTTSMPEGSYVLRVVASDRADNPSGGAAGELSSAAFPVDHTPPRFASADVSLENGSLVVEGVVEDAASAVVIIEVAVDFGAWERAFASDGILDSRREAYRRVFDGIAGGPHAVAVRAVDRAGNVGVARRAME